MDKVPQVLRVSGAETDNEYLSWAARPARARRAVKDIMTRDVATVDAPATVDEAARIMSKQNISCLIAMHRGEAAGIFTEKDLLRRIVALHGVPTQTRVVEVMSSPILAVPPTYSILSASKKMDTMHLHHLVVMEGKEVRGIVTQSDILRAIRDEFKAMEMQQREMAARFAGLVRTVLPDTQNLQTFLDETRNQRGTVSGATAKPATPGSGAAMIGKPCILWSQSAHIDPASLARHRSRDLPSRAILPHPTRPVARHSGI